MEAFYWEPDGVTLQVRFCEGGAARRAPLLSIRIITYGSGIAPCGISMTCHRHSFPDVVRSRRDTNLHGINGFHCLGVRNDPKIELTPDRSERPMHALPICPLPYDQEAARSWLNRVGEVYGLNAERLISVLGLVPFQSGSVSRLSRPVETRRAAQACHDAQGDHRRQHRGTFHRRAVVGVQNNLTRFDLLALTQILQQLTRVGAVFFGKHLGGDDLAAENIDVQIHM